jgi:hypothetical protein
VANPFRYTLRLPGKHHGEKEDNGKEQKSGWPGASRLGATISPGHVLTVRLVKTVDAAESFLRHADLSPDGHPLRHSTKGNRALRIPLTTHRWDESDRVFLAGCSPAEPASASSIHSAYQSCSCSICQRSTGRSLRFRGLCTGVSAPNTPHRLFQGRPGYLNSIFVDGVSALFPQMDVWPRCHCVGPIKGSMTVQNPSYPLARRTHSARVKGNLRFPLTITYHGCPRNRLSLESTHGVLH